MLLLDNTIQIGKMIYRFIAEFFILLKNPSFRKDIFEFKKIIKMCNSQNIEYLAFGNYKYFLWSYIIGISDINPIKFQNIFFEEAISFDKHFYFGACIRVNKIKKTKLIKIIENTSLVIGEKILIDYINDENPLVSIPQGFISLKNELMPKNLEELLKIFALSKTNDKEMIIDYQRSENSTPKIVFQEDLIKYIKVLLNISLMKACLLRKSFIPPNIIVKIFNILGKKKTLFFVSKLRRFWKAYFLKTYPKMAVITEVHYCLEKKLFQNIYEGE